MKDDKGVRHLLLSRGILGSAFPIEDLGSGMKYSMAGSGSRKGDDSLSSLTWSEGREAARPTGFVVLNTHVPASTTFFVLLTGCESDVCRRGRRRFWDSSPWRIG